MSQFTTLDAWTDICQSLFPRRHKSASVHPIHSCIINGQRHYIHSPKLVEEDPSYFQRLTAYAAKHSIKLKADRRAPIDESGNGRRKKLLPIMFLAMGVNAGAAFSETRESTLNMVPQNSMVAPLHEHKRFTPELESYTTPVNKESSKKIQSILASHFEGQSDDPHTIAADMQSLADYYSTHPEATALIESLAEEEWQLKYAPHTFQTDVKGSRVHVNEVAVYFDPRSGAKLKFYDKCATKVPFCVASPADALLHELLHVHSILKDTDNFIADGGLDNHMYPAAHERKTILKENILYKSMSRRDQHPRPIRSEHTGRHVLVSCVTCVE
ncbi:MAG: hypothetical protein K6L81_02135 [Agarilytica sp.]